MKKIVTIIALFVVIGAQAQQTKKVTADKIIGVVGDRIVLKSDIENQINDARSKDYELPPDASCYLMQQLIINKMLAIQAEKDSLPVSEEEVEADVENRIRYFIQQYGSKEVIEQITGKTIYQFREEMRDPIRETKLATAMRGKIVENVKITPTEVRAFFNKIPKDSLAFYETELEIGEIVVYPKAGREMEEYAQEELKEFKRQVEAGTKKMEFLAAQYSEDPAAKENAGLYVLNRGDNQWDPTFFNTAMSLKEGQVSRVIKSKFGYHIIQCLSRNGEEVTVRHILKIPRINEDDINDAINKLDSVRSKLIAGTIKFGEAVSKYSDDTDSKFTAGMMRGQDGSSIITIDQLDKDMIPVLEKLKPGEFSQPFQFTDLRGKKGVRLVFLVNRTPPHRENMENDYSKIAGRALEEKKEKELEKWFIKNSNTFYVQIEDEYKDCAPIKAILGNTAKN
nr:peptidylprolyl isomerase [uncultured Lacibacter sp.]